MAGYGGAREGAGRKQLDAGIKRKTRSVVVRDDEWEIVKAFVAAVKMVVLKNVMHSLKIWKTMIKYYVFQIKRI